MFRRVAFALMPRTVTTAHAGVHIRQSALMPSSHLNSLRRMTTSPTPLTSLTSHVATDPQPAAKSQQRKTQRKPKSAAPSSRSKSRAKVVKPKAAVRKQKMKPAEAKAGVKSTRK